MPKRRNPFETSTQTPVSAHPPSIYDSLRVAAPRQRNRQWEKKHLSQKVVYRGVDPKLALKVKSIAGNLLVPSGEVARAVIEYALRAYERGDLELHPRPNPYRLRMTLFPTSEAMRSQAKATRSPGRKQPGALWRVIVTWRGFSLDLKNELSSLASEDNLNVPIGELITALLRFGLKAYDTDLLTLEPVQKTNAYTLAQVGRK